jgi:hypothetical protein
MNRKALGLVGGAVLVASLAFGLGQVFAQRDKPEPVLGELRVGRFQLVSVQPGEIILLDTATGDLYSAAPADLKPFDKRPKPAAALPPAPPPAPAPAAFPALPPAPPAPPPAPR